MNDDTRIVIGAAGGIQVLVDVARDGNEDAKASAGGALRCLSMNADIRITAWQQLVGSRYRRRMIRDTRPIAGHRQVQWTWMKNKGGK